MLGPEVIGGVIAVSAATVGIAVKMYTSGGTAEADLDSDGNPELSVSSDGSSGGKSVFEDKDGNEYAPSGQFDDVPFQGENGDVAGNPLKGVGEELESASLPERVKNVGKNLQDITGVGKTRAQTFKNEGFMAASDLYYASDKTLLDIKGIGDHALSQIRGDIGGVDE